jgi:hypothetical protein
VPPTFHERIHTHQCQRCGTVVGEGQWTRREVKAKNKNGSMTPVVIRTEITCYDCLAELRKMAETIAQRDEEKAQGKPRKKSKKPPCPANDDGPHYLVQEKPGQPFVCKRCGWRWVDPETAAGVLGVDISRRAG